jgi:hypothetical protein
VHTCGWAANFTDTISAKWELAMNTLHKVKSTKPLYPTHISFKSLNPIKTWCKGYCDLLDNSLYSSSSHSLLTLTLDSLTTCFAGPHYIALGRTAQKTLSPTVLLLLWVYSLPSNGSLVSWYTVCLLCHCPAMDDVSCSVIQLCHNTQHLATLIN